MASSKKVSIPIEEMSSALVAKIRATEAARRKE
jgi:hypothetical protein